MSETSHKVTDRRGGKNPKPAEACRVCGSSTVHTRKYNHPTMECIEYLRGYIKQTRDQIPGIEKRLQVLERLTVFMFDKNSPRRFRLPIKDKHPNGTNSAWRYGAYFPMTDLVVMDMGERGTGEPGETGTGWSGLEWLDLKAKNDDHRSQIPACGGTENTVVDATADARPG